MVSKKTSPQASKRTSRTPASSSTDSTTQLLARRQAEAPCSLSLTATKREFRKLTSAEAYRRCEIPKEIVKKYRKYDPDYDIISQERAVRAITVGLGVHKPGYNIYVAGVQGTGKTSVIRSFLQKTADKLSAPGDWIYVYNFKAASSPRAIALGTGQAKKFKKDMEEFVDLLVEEIPAALQSEEYENNVNATINANNDRKAKLFADLEKTAKGMNFGVKSTRMGIVTVPIIEGKPLSEKEYSELSDEQKEEIEQSRNALEPEVLDFVRKARVIENETRERLEQLRADVGDYVVSSAMGTLLKEYENNKEIIEYLGEVRDDILENLSRFVSHDEDGDDEERSEPSLPQRKGDPYLPYRVNIFIDNTDVQGAPIIIETNPTFYNLFGKIEKNIEYGIYTTDFKMIKAGSLARANGGYLVLNALDVFRNPHVWETLKRVIKNQKLFIEDLGEQFSLLPTSGLRPEPIALNVKIVLIGSDWVYRTLYQLDEDFNKIFKIKAEFDTQMDRTGGHIEDYVRFISGRSKLDDLLPFAADAMAAMVEHSSRVVEDQEKLTTRFSLIKDLAIESDFMAKERNAKAVEASDVYAAVDEKYVRSALIDDHITEMISRGDLIVSTNTRRAGEINALVVYDLGDISFGKPSRITCRTYKGKPGIINIDREASLSGKIHNKGVGILSSWLNSVFGRKGAPSVSATLCFEQNYSGVDGDSATLAEMLLVTTTVANIPLDQAIAVTGSVNQFGEVQPVGGVNDKIEGFFKTCRIQGLTGRQGVILPHQNVKNLMLAREVADAIEEGKFHIWPVTYVEEALELITGFTAGEWSDKSRSFTHKSVFERVEQGMRNKLPHQRQTTSAKGKKEPKRSTSGKKPRKKPGNKPSKVPAKKPVRKPTKKPVKKPINPVRKTPRKRSTQPRQGS